MTGRIVAYVAAMVLALMFNLCGCADVGLQPQFKAEVMMTSGERVRLFYGGTQEAKDIFCKGETVSVYREDPRDPKQVVEVGKVNILGSLGDQYLEGLVVEGKIKEGDLAKKAIAACMVLPFKHR